MLKVTTAFALALLAAVTLDASSTGASAGWRHYGCCGGPLPPSYVYHTVNSVSHVTRYHDVSQTRYVDQPQPIVHVTRVQPLVYVNDVTRVHYVTVPVVRPYDVYVTQTLPPQQVVTQSYAGPWGCGCQ